MEMWEALKFMQEGKKVRRKIWAKDEYLILDSYKDIVDNYGTLFRIDCLHHDWEIVE